MIKYNQTNCEKKIAELLKDEGWMVSRNSLESLLYHLKVSYDGKEAKFFVSHLQRDHAYDNSSLPYQVYKIDAFKTNEQRDEALKEVQFVVGYNFLDDCFACVPIVEFKHVRSVVVHPRDGLRHQYYNSWSVLNHYFGAVKHDRENLFPKILAKWEDLNNDMKLMFDYIHKIETLARQKREREIAQAMVGEGMQSELIAKLTGIPIEEVKNMQTKVFK